MKTNLRLAQEPSTTRPAPTPCLQQQGFRDALQRLTMTLMLVMLTAMTAWAATNGTIPNSTLSWEYNTTTKTLYISGSGAMPNLQSSSSYKMPWEQSGSDYKADIEHINIEAGVTTIGDYNFDNVSNLQDVTFEGNQVTYIGTYAFMYCSKLATITLPTSLTTIGSYAFGNSGLTSITIPANVTTIRSNAFYDAALTEVIFAEGSKLTTIESYAFQYTKISSITIPEGVTSLGGYAFYYCTYLSSVTLPASLTSINMGVFYHCTSLQNITIPSGVTSIGHQAFKESGLTSATIPANVTNIDNEAFKNCTSLTKVIVIPTTLPTLGNNVFEGNATDRKFFTNESYVSTDGWSTYAANIEARTIWDADGIVALYDNSNKTLTIEKGNSTGVMADYDTKPQPWASEKANITTVVIETGVTNIGKKAFYGHAALTTVNMLTASVPTVDSQAFDNCATGFSIIVPNGLYYDYYNATGWSSYADNIKGTCGDNARYHWNPTTQTLTISGTGDMADYTDTSPRPWHSYQDDLRTVVIEPSVTSIGTKAFYSCNRITSLTIGSDVTSIGANAFDGCSSLSSIHIPASVTSIGEDAFAYCTNVPAITVAAGNTVYDSRDNCNAIIETNTNKLILGCINTKIPATVTEIGKNAFENCDKTAITIPYGVTTIGNQAFVGCDQPTSVSIPASVTSIGGLAFVECYKLASVIIYAPSLTKYGANAFDYNDSDRKIYVFSNCVDTYKEGWNYYAGDIEAIPDVTVSGVTVNQNPEVTSDYWCTYYHPAANVKINTMGVEIYKAALNGTSSVTLTKVDGDVIKAGQAVMLKAPASGSLSMELTPDEATGDYSGNELKGGETVASGKTAYTLAAKNNKMGFYKFAGTALNPNKAHLEIATPPSSAPEYLGFGDDDSATSISTTDRTDSTDKADEWYNLDGRKLSGEPSAKGVYVKNGRKFIIK